MFHCLFRCPIYNPVQTLHISRHSTQDNFAEGSKNLLITPAKEKMYRVFKFLQAALKIKALILNVQIPTLLLRNILSFFYKLYVLLLNISNLFI